MPLLKSKDSDSCLLQSLKYNNSPFFPYLFINCLFPNKKIHFPFVEKPVLGGEKAACRPYTNTPPLPPISNPDFENTHTKANLYEFGIQAESGQVEACHAHQTKGGPPTALLLHR